MTKKYLLQEKNHFQGSASYVIINGSIVSIPHLYYSNRAFISDPIDYADNKKHNKEISGKPRLENFYRNRCKVLVNSSRKLKIMMQTK